MFEMNGKARGGHVIKNEREDLFAFLQVLRAVDDVRANDPKVRTDP
jgi:hypothetical protein